LKLRTQLILLVLAAVIPLLSFTGLVIYQDIGEQREILGRGMRNTVRALSLALDGEVKAVRSILETLAVSPSLAADEYGSFHAQSTRAIAGLEGAYIILFDKTGQQLVNTRFTFGDALPNPLLQAKPPAADRRFPLLPVGGDAIVREILTTRRPVVSDLFVALSTGRPTIGIGIPIMRGEAPHYVLQVAIEPEPLLRLLRAHRLPEDSVASLLDRNGAIIARTFDAEGRLGDRLAPKLAAQAATAAEGAAAGRTKEGLQVLHAYTRSQMTGWTVSLAVSEVVIAGPVRRAVILLVGGAALAVLLGMAAAIFFGRRIARPISMLAGSAPALVRGERPKLDVPAVHEMQELHGALVSAGAVARESALEREGRLLAEEAERRFRMIADSAPAMLWVTDPDGRVTFLSRGWYAFTAQTESQALGKDGSGWLDAVHPDDREHAGRIFMEANRGREEFAFDYRLRRAEGDYRWAIDAGRPRFDAAGAFLGYVGIVIDITERKQAEEALHRADRAKDEFLAMLSHELRNPLAALTSAAHVLNVVAPASDQASKARGVVERQTRHMSRLVGDLLDISRVTLGKFTLQRERFDAAQALSNVINGWCASGPLDDHAVSLAAEPAWVEGDRARFEQIASNLLDNARKFTPAGKNIAVSLRREGGEAVLQIADEGIGLSAEDCSRVFELFVQSDFPEPGGGLGIGLALVKRLAELHGGSVSAASEGPGRGATFTVRLPAVDQPAVRAETLRPVVPRVRSILIVEDNEDARQMLRAALIHSGHEVRAACDGKTGLALAAEAHPEVALIDIALPDMDGYEVARRLRALNGNRRIDLIAVTGFGQEEDQRRAYAAGFDMHLVKPVTPERLNQVIAGLQ
jgi:PAS domain S-box-containing protein